MKRCMGCMAEMEDCYTLCGDCGYEAGTPPREAYHMEPGTILHGRYIAGRVLGFGGFGVTYMGWDEQLYRKVAIKEFLPSACATRIPGFTELSIYGGESGIQFRAGLERFVEEARRLAKFNGIQGIVDIYDTFVENNTAYIVMEYLQGQDVKMILEQEGVFSYEEAREIMLKLCETLKPVHREGIIHRDISPDNIYLTDGGDVKLLDFGASRYATGVNSKSLSVILKGGYAPEEQYRSHGNQGSWSDVYALAATFYKMITGVTPPDSMERAIGDELKEPSKLGVQLPQEGETAILNALNIRSENRTQTVEEFARQLCSHKVERVREKAVREDTGKLPLWGKILLGGGIGLTLLFGLLTVTGVVNLGQGNILADQFGSGVKDGYANTPGLINLMEDKAQKMVKKAGLDYLITGREYSDKIAKGKILTQSPLPGRVIALGDTIQVTISGGSRQDAVAAGEMAIPDVTFLDIREAIYTMEAAGFYHYTDYEFSDTVAEGLVIRYEPDEESGGVRLIVSAGKEGQNGEYGQVRAPFVDSAYGGLRYAVTVEQILDVNQMVRHEVQYSTDQGNTWNTFKDLVGDPWNEQERYYMDEEYQPIAQVSYDLSKVIVFANPDLSDKELMLQIVRYAPGQTEVMDVTRVPGTITINMTEKQWNVTAMEILDWETVKKLDQEGKWGEYHRFTYDLTDEGAMNYQSPVHLEGDFNKGGYYDVMTRHQELGSPMGGNLCEEDGILYLPVQSDWAEAYGDQPATWHIMKESTGYMEENHGVVMKVESPVVITIKNGIVTEDSVGKPFLEAAEVHMGVNNRIDISFERSGQEPGTVLREHMGNMPFYAVSVGEITDRTPMGEVMTALLFAQQYDELLYAGVYGGEDFDPGNICQVLYSEDGGNTYETLTDSRGNEIEMVTRYGDNNDPTLYRIGFPEAARWLLKERTDLWEKELKLAVQGQNRVAVRETLLIQNDTEPVTVTSVIPLGQEALIRYYQEGRIASGSFGESIYKSIPGGGFGDYVAVFSIEGSFQEGKNYYIMAGGTQNSYISFPCIRDGELIFGYWKSSEIDEETRNAFRNTLIQGVTYEYIREKKQLTVHVSLPVTMDLEILLD